ncbi:hypothetical protein IE53DRAFT_165967 [Violaceomyces palustris]|uniref:Uncharacterized protein n=1 Tax=Violaceomyces palustris TaxID=1673888 RepID=A0ACD0NTD5_9BASI|nr:hypothetical protein IE53DRAFT_165967 [Violaceomyces palustris]
MLRRPKKKDSGQQQQQQQKQLVQVCETSHSSVGDPTLRESPVSSPTHSPSAATTPLPEHSPHSAHSSPARPHQHQYHHRYDSDLAIANFRARSPPSPLDAMPPPASFQHPSAPASQVSQGGYQQQQQQQPMGRSQSAFNFLLSKAKFPFSSSGSSNSLSSLSTHVEDPFLDGTGQVHQYQQQQQQQQQKQQSHHHLQHQQQHHQSRHQQSYPHGYGQPPSRMVMPQAIPGAATTSRSSTSDSLNGRSGGVNARPSVSEEPGVSSPTKRGFFGGMGRDRKVSNASSSKVSVASKTSFSHSPLTKGLRADSGGQQYPQFSKSQSDLHMRPEFPSPGSVPVELPRVSQGRPMAPSSSDRSTYLKSPSPSLPYSRSVDDLSSIDPAIVPFAPHHPHGALEAGSKNASAASQGGTWGEHGLVAGSDWRPSDMGTLQTNPRDSHIPRSPRIDPLASQIPLSTAPSHQQAPPLQNAAWPAMPAAEAGPFQPPSQGTRHNRKISKLSSASGSREGLRAGAGSLASSLGLLSIGSNSSADKQSVSSQSSVPPSPTPLLPPGAVFQGFLARNQNISLTLSQLNDAESGKGKEREKDITKGWKPYRVVLQDGKLFFYKPPSSISDEVKALFPPSHARAMEMSGSGSRSAMAQYVKEVGMDADMLKRSGLGKSELLTATSSATSAPISPASTTSGHVGPTSSASVGGAAPGPSLSRTDTDGPSSRVTAAPDRAVRQSVHGGWEMPGRHPDLCLVGALEAPPSWPARISHGSIQALAHELVNRTQQPDYAKDGAGSKQAQLDLDSFVRIVLLSLTRITSGVQSFLAQIGVWSSTLMVNGFDSGSGPNTHLQSLVESIVETILEEGLLAAERDEVLSDELISLIDLVMAGDQAEKISNDVREAKAGVKCNADRLANPPRTEESPGRQDLAELREAKDMSDLVLLQLDPLELAQQIQIFHANRLSRVLESGGLQASVLIRPDLDALASLFCFDSASPHFLTQLALRHILSDDEVKTNPKRGVISQVGARRRASILRHWIAVGSYLYSLGCYTGWVAVCAALCSRAVTRLEQTWRYLAEGDREMVSKEWAPILTQIAWTEGTPVAVQPLILSEDNNNTVETRDGTKLAVLPFLGNSAASFKRHCQPERPEGDLRLLVSAQLEESTNLSHVLRRFHEDWYHGGGGGADLASLADEDAALGEYQVAFHHLSAGTHQGMDLSQALSRSLKLEPKTLGNLDLSYVPPASPQAIANSLLPLLFPQPLPHLSLLDASRVRDRAAGIEQRFNSSGITKDSDPYATITLRSHARASLGGSPLVRSAAFSPVISGRTGKNIAYGAITEWSPWVGSSQDDNGSTLKIGGELVLKVISEPSASLPSSPMAGKRFSQDFGRATRPLSQVSKRSSLPTSNRSSVADLVVPIHVVVKAATLERMVDVLVMGVQHVTTSSQEESENSNSALKKTRLILDLEAYRTTFLATFRSFCTPIVLFEFLRKRFVAAVNASKEMNAMETFQTSSQFPSWSIVKPVGSHVEPVDWDVVYRIRIGVIMTLRQWVERFAQDFVEDDALYRLMHAFVRDPGMEPNPEDADQPKVLNALAQLAATFRASIMSANARSEEKVYTLNSASASRPWEGGSPSAEINFDDASPADLVEYLESIATVFFDKIVERDLLVVAELFEKQASDLTGWFAAKNGSASDDEKQINNIYMLFDVLRPPGTDSKDIPLQQLLPAAVRDALAAQSLLKGWIAIHIIESKIGLRTRQARLEKLLDAVWICRARMLRLRTEDPSPTPVDGPAPFRECTIASFVECAIVGSLTSYESRYFLRAWQGVASSRRGTGDSLSDLFPIDVPSSFRNAASAPCTPDVGWILTCLAEATTRAPSCIIEGMQPLLNFEKRKTIWTIVDSSVRVRPPGSSPSLVELAGARLKFMQAALGSTSWDRRAFREDAASEAATAPTLGQNTTVRFNNSSKALPGLAWHQHEKTKRERAALEYLELLRSRPSAKDTVTSLGLSSSNSASSQSSSTAIQTPQDKATIRSRRMTALFRGGLRPIGLMSEKAETPTHTVEELLRLTTLGKPGLVAGCGGAQVAAWPNSQRPYVFHLTSEEGAKYLIQAPTQGELADWFAHIDRASKERPARRPFEIKKGSSSKGKPIVAPLYGVSLPLLVEREGRDVPIAIERMFAEVEARGLREQGIYRISGAKSSIEALKDAFGKQPPELVDLSQGEFSDIHTICGAIKQWFRDLPEPAITFASYNSIIEAERIENHDSRLYAIRDIIWDLPKCHFDLLRRTAEHLARVVEEGEHNLMAPHNIGLVFGASLLNPPPGPSSMAASFGNLGKAAHIVKIIVTMHEWLFEPEPEPEPLPEVVAEVLEAPETDRRGEGSLAEGVPEKAISAQGAENGGPQADSHAMARGISSESEPVTPVDGEQVCNPILQSDRGRQVHEVEERIDRALESGPKISINDGSGDLARSSLGEERQRPEEADKEGGREDDFGTVTDTPSVAKASASGQALQRPKRTRDGYRDSVFSSYSIYADCLDSFALDSSHGAKVASAPQAKRLEEEKE